MILETNYKIVEYGTNLHLDARYASVETLDTSPDMLEKACSRLRSRAGLAAVVCGDRLLVLSRKEFADQTLEGDDWRMIVKDAGTAKRLRFGDYKDRKLMAMLVERAMLAQIGRRTALWTLDSPRIWYEEEPFLTLGGIRAYRRYEVSAEIIEEVGIGIAVNVATAFFTVNPVSYFFDEKVSAEVRAQRIKQFERLSERQKGMKGTLLYKPDEKASKCWFVDFQKGKTCGSEATNFKLHGETFDSLLDYYNRRRPNAKIRAEESVARVSFQTLGSKQNSNGGSGGSQRSVQVSADRLWLRVTNNVLPKQMQNVDKIVPQNRVELTDGFWNSFGEVRLGGQARVAKEYWRPDSKNVMHVKSPNLLFGGGKILPSPPNGKLSDHQDFFRQRRRFLDKAGCWNVPTAIGRVIPFAISQEVGTDAAKRFTDDLTERVARWTGKDMQSKDVAYSDFDDAFTQINGNSWKPGVSVFVFENGDPENYYRVAQGLKTWRVKRVTLENLRKNYRNLRAAEQQQRQSAGRNGYRHRGNSGNRECERAVRDWNSFVDMCALDVLEQLGCVPWGFAGSALNYEAHLAIDVGEEGRHFALTLLICRSGGKGEPMFRIQTRVFPKTNFKQENINRLVLRDAVVTLFKMVAGGRAFPALNSLLVLRDGRECGEELEAINDARELLVQEGWLAGGAKLDVVDFHKSSLKGIRLWKRNADDSIENVLEGLALFLSRKKVVLATTGAATVRNGTANPVMLEARTDNVDMKKVLEDVFAGCQLNFSSPGKAHRLHIALRRCDEEIRRFEAQEIKRLK